MLALMKSWLVSMCLTVLVPQLANAATFSLGGQEDLRCVITMTGPINSGTAAGLRSFVSANWQVLAAPILQGEFPDDGGFGERENRLCLDSPGGSLTEALDIIDTLLFGANVFSEGGDFLQYKFFRSLGTAVPRNAACESACALIFMAGGWFDHNAARDYTRLPDRVLDIEGHLGFHAPNLLLQQGVYTDRDVQTAFDYAIQIARMIGDRSRVMYFPPSLFQTWVSTPFDEMFFVRYIGQAASWGIDLHGAPTIQGFTSANARNVCDNFGVLSEVGITNRERYGNAFVPTDVLGRGGNGFQLSGWFENNFTYRPSWSLPEFPSHLREWDEVASGIREEAVSACSVSITRDPFRIQISEMNVMDSGFQSIILEADEGDWAHGLGESQAWLLYPPYVRIADLAEFRDRQVRGDTVASQVTQVGEIPCVSYREMGGSPANNLACVVRIDATFSLDGLSLEQTVSVYYENSSDVLFSYNVQIAHGRSEYFTEVISPISPATFRGRLIDSSNWGGPPPRALVDERDLSEPGMPDGRWLCFTPSADSRVVCINNRNSLELAFDTSLDLFPSYRKDELIQSQLFSIPTVSLVRFVPRATLAAVAVEPPFLGCWLTLSSARITNVSEYVNLRRQPDFSSSILRQVQLGERVRLQQADNITITGQERDRQSCINACQAFSRNAEDRTARNRTLQCIQDNMIWYEVNDARGNRGWISRRYLEETQ